ncbi:MAG: glutamate carboxypeptidase [Pseudomonadota bacterium]|nr:glutamate carboxypeptidase [Pseudomonadota bacterium]
MSIPNPRRTPLALALLLTCAATAAHGAPNAQLLDAANQAQPAVIDSLKTMVGIESGSGDRAGLARMASLIDDRLTALGFKTERRKSPVGAGADTVVGTLVGSGARKIMLQGHMDTVYQPGILKEQPIKLDGNRIYGPGIADDKGGLAVILHALKILRDAGWTDFATLTVLVNADEEVGSPGSGETIAALAAGQDYVLSCEPTTAKAVAKTEALLLGAAGAATVTMEVRGRASHAGAAPALGRNAILEISQQILATKDLARDIPGAAMNWTNVVSNKAVNQIPELAVAIADVRMTIPGAEQKLDAALQAKIASSKLIADTQTTATLVVVRPAFLAGPKGRALGERAQAIYKELDRDLSLVPMTGAATDAGFAARSGKATVVESFGLAGFGYHARDEYIEVDSIVPRLYLMTRLLQELGRE